MDTRTTQVKSLDQCIKDGMFNRQHASILKQAQTQYKYQLPWTRSAMAEFSGIAVSSLCARLIELERRGAIRRCGTLLDYKTNREVTAYELHPDYCGDIQ